MGELQNLLFKFDTCEYIECMLYAFFNLDATSSSPDGEDVLKRIYA